MAKATSCSRTSAARPKQRPLFTVADLGPNPDPSRLPARLDRLNAATLMTAMGLPVAPRSLERAEGIVWARAGVVATARTADLIAYARRRLGEAPAIAVGGSIADAPPRGPRRQREAAQAPQPTPPAAPAKRSRRAASA
ncbi:hypothetical protein GCM10011320_35900 [Neoroseomonas lacus]|uniref:Uncharacterized protein n=1 Tax=Neoroseomonas lacus TaxID=287609 RepID=A0A917KS94_9PROT|nr:hypothetical protein GCM10011320_35900 [Neoroseomonas lacus]